MVQAALPLPVVKRWCPVKGHYVTTPLVLRLGRQVCEKCAVRS